MIDVLRIARLKIALQRAFLGRAILIFTLKNMQLWGLVHPLKNWDKDITPFSFSWLKVHNAHLFIISEWEDKM